MNTQTTTHPSVPYIAFNGLQCMAAGTLGEVAAEVKRVMDVGRHNAILLFDAHTSEQVEIDTRGSLADVAQRYGAPPVGAGAAPSEQAAAAEAADSETEAPRTRGRPKLGVVAREVTLLPRHWEWLATQPGGASVVLRKLVEDARRANVGRDVARKSRETAYRFMSAIGGGLEHFEEATRALFAGDRLRFEALLDAWPADVRAHAVALAQDSFSVG